MRIFTKRFEVSDMMAISQRLAALKSSSFSGLFRNLRACGDSRSGRPAAQSSSCVSSRSFTAPLRFGAEQRRDLTLAHLIDVVRHGDLARLR